MTIVCLYSIPYKSVTDIKNLFSQWFVSADFQHIFHLYGLKIKVNDSFLNLTQIWYVLMYISKIRFLSKGIQEFLR